MSYADVKAALVVIQLVLLVLGFLFAGIAARGYRGTAWGRVLRPLPAVLALLAAGAGISLLPSTPANGGIYTTVLLGIALVGIVYATVQFVRVMRRGQRAGG